MRSVSMGIFEERVVEHEALMHTAHAATCVAAGAETAGAGVLDADWDTKKHFLAFL